MTGGYILITSVEGAKKSALRVIELEAKLAERDALIKRLVETGDVLSDERMSNLHNTFSQKWDGLVTLYGATVADMKIDGDGK